MSITDILKRTGGRITSFRGIVLIGKDGLIVEKYGINDSSFETLAVEFLSLLSKFDGLLDERNEGTVEEATIRGGTVDYIMTSVDDSYYLILGVGIGEHIGRSRFELKKAAYDLRQELAE